MEKQDMPSSSSSKPLFVILILLLVGSAAGVAVLRHRRDAQLQAEVSRRDQSASLGPKVYVAPVTLSSGERTVVLPGSVRAAQQAILAAKVTGYLKTIAVDKGDTVKRGQVLATLESPETDQQVIAAEAELELRQRDVERVRKLAPSGFSTQQQIDSAETDLKAATATLARLRALQRYQTISAPFDGVVSARYLDPGALVQATAPVLEVVDLTYTKVVVDVGQDVAPFLKVGDAVKILQDERPELVLEATVSRLAPGLNSTLRTLSTEIDLASGKARLQPGTFVRVSLRVKVPSLPIVPLDAVIVRGEQLLAAVVKNDRVSMVPIVPGLSDGTTLQVKNGLQGGELVALNLPTQLEDQSQIQPVQKKPAAPAGAPVAAPAGAPVAAPAGAPAAAPAGAPVVTPVAMPTTTPGASTRQLDPVKH
jgi:membrane fusion protein, multidrug efflux system